MTARYHTILLLFLLFWTPKLFSQNDCKTWTYQLELTAPFAEVPTDALTLPSGGYIICGYDSSSAGKRGRIIKLSKDGTVVMSKSITVGGNSFVINKIKCFSNGKLYSIAEHTDGASGVISPVILVIDSATLQVTKAMKLNLGAGSWRGADIGADPFRYFFVLATNDSLITVSRFHLDGAFNWSRATKTEGKPLPVGMYVAGGALTVAYNEQIAGFTKSSAVRYLATSGLILSSARLGGAVSGESFKTVAVAGDAPSFNNGASSISFFSASAAVHIRNNQSFLVRLNQTFGTPATIVIDSFALGSFQPDSSLTFATTPLWDIVAASSDAEPQAVYMGYSYRNTWPGVIVKKLVLPYAVQVSKVLYGNESGAFLVCKKRGASGGIVIAKLDSTGSLTGCSIQEMGGMIGRRLTQGDASPPEFLLHDLDSLQLQPVVTDQMLTSSFQCKSMSCPQVASPDTCLKTFLKEYNDDSREITVDNLLKTSSGNLLAFLHAPSVPDELFRSSSFAVFGPSGNVISSSMLRSSIPIELFICIRLKDGNFLAAGSLINSSAEENQYLVKFNEQLNIIWQKRLISEAYNRQITHIIETSEGELICVLWASNQGQAGVLPRLLKLDALGNPIWFRSYKFVNSTSTSPFQGIAEIGSFIYLHTIESISNKFTVLRVNKSDGSVSWSKRYLLTTSNNPNGYVGGMTSVGSSLYFSGAVQGKPAFVKINANGNVMFARTMPGALFQYNNPRYRGDNRFILSTWMYQPGGNVVGAVEMDTNYVVLKKQFIKLPKLSDASISEPYNDSLTYGAIQFVNSYRRWRSLGLIKYSFNNSFGSCEVSDMAVGMSPFNVTTQTNSISSTSLELPLALSFNASLAEADLAYSSFHCGNQDACSQVSLAGPGMICDSTNVFNYNVTRNPGCNGMTKWVIDTLPGAITVVSISDTLLKIKVRNGGTFKIIVKVFGNCRWVEDSLAVEASSSSVLGLGPDDMICEGNTKVLNAHVGFSSYQWQDGSTDSTLSIDQPGIYSVKAKSCGVWLYDTIVITAAPPVPMDPGPDRIKCNDDTVNLHGPPGFINYFWSNQYEISSLTGQHVTVNPLVDTVYYLQAEKTPGCFGFDTIRVFVYNSPSIDLGNDRSFCKNDSVQLTAGNGFAQYQWSTGAGTSQAYISMPGSITVEATTIEGCKSRDTILLQWFTTLTELDHRDGICEGGERLLDPGGFSAYLWSTGSTSQTVFVTLPGTYSVLVTDVNNCKFSDSVVITKYLPLPRHFLPADTAICLYRDLLLKSNNNFSSYLWSTGTTSPSIKITSAGTYWLQVQDDRECYGRDTVIVLQKDCGNGLYAPDAFTPNGDGRNDVFRVFLYQRFENFELSVYNRWGQRVFYTTNPEKGWDGKVGDTLQSTSTFVWTCSYTIPGEGRRVEKGSFVLIR